MDREQLLNWFLPLSSMVKLERLQESDSKWRHTLESHIFMNGLGGKAS